MKTAYSPVLCILLILSHSWAPLLAQAPAGQAQQPEFAKQGQQLMREGKLQDALALFRQTLQSMPLSLQANLGAGVVLDRMGQGEEGRKYFSKAIEISDTPEHKAAAQRAMAMSYAFEGDCKNTVEYEKKVMQFDSEVKNVFQQGERRRSRARLH
jgi:Flp pilus assembly protein TadD